MTPVYPWQHGAWQALQEMSRQGRLGHALLCHGESGSGLSEFAASSAAWLLCKQPRTPCGQCRDCRQLAIRQHPELLHIQPAEETTQIRVQQIRELIDFMQLKAFARRKVVIIDPAEAMNRSAANTLLKTLEEPAGLALIILVVRRLHGVPITLRSRCQLLSLHSDINAETRQWLRERLSVDDERLSLLLELAQNRPLLALRHDELVTQQLAHGAQCLELMENRLSPLELARLWDQAGPEQSLSWFLFLLQALARTRLGAVPPRWLAGTGLQKCLKHLQLLALSECCAETLKARRLLLSPANFRTLGVLEELLLFCQPRLVTAMR